MRLHTETGWSSYAFAQSFVVFGLVWQRDCVRCRTETARHEPQFRMTQLGVVLFNRFFGIVR